jgi:hypothetical protein
MFFDQKNFSYVEFIHPHKILPRIQGIAGALILMLSMSAGLYALLSLINAAQPLATLTSMTQLNYQILLLAREFGLGPRPGLPSVVELYLLVVSAALALTIHIYFAVESGIFVGLRALLDAFLQWRSIGHPEDAPEDLDAPGYIIEKMIKPESYANGIQDKRLIGLFGLNVQRISPLATSMTEPHRAAILEWLRDTAVLIRKMVVASVVLAAIIMLPVWIYAAAQPALNFSYALSAVGAAAGFWPSAQVLIAPYLLMACLEAGFRLLDYLFVAALVPRKFSKPESLTLNNRVVAPTSPYLISEEFPRLMEKFRRPDEPNRIATVSAEVSAVSVGDTGNFRFTGLIEQAPRAIRSPHERAALAWLISGWIVVFISLAALLAFLLPASVVAALEIRRLPAPVHVVTPLTVVLYAIVANKAYRQGRRMVKEGTVLLESYWFVSPGLAYQVIGTTSRSEIKVGRGRDDSIETSSTVNRSEYLYDLTTAMLLSEAERVDGPRRLVGMWNDEASRVLLDASYAEMTGIVSRRAAPVNIDLRDAGLRDHLEANAAIEAVRRRQAYAVRGEGRDRVNKAARLPDDESD